MLPQASVFLQALIVEWGRHVRALVCSRVAGCEGDCVCLANVFSYSRGRCGVSVVLWCVGCGPRALCDLEKFVD